MSEQEKSDHWGHLLSDLGVDSPPKEEAVVEVESAAPAVEPAPVPRPKSVRQLPPQELRRSPNDWLQLANQLGVEVPEEAFAPKPPEPRTVPAAEPPRRSQPVAAAPSRVEHPAETFEAVASEAIGEAEAEVVEVDRWDTGVEAIEPPQEATDKKLRRRRKRRRKTRRPEEAPARADRGSEDEELDADQFVELVDPFEEEGVELIPAETAGEDQPEAVSEEEPQKRSKRRRRRRSSRKKTKEEGESPAADSDEIAVAESLDEDMDGDDLDEDSESDGAEAGPEGRSRDKRALHRGIPNWKDAIDVVISANLEARAKRPDRGSGSRGRGGRNRGREKSEKNG